MATVTTSHSDAPRPGRRDHFTADRASTRVLTQFWPHFTLWPVGMPSRHDPRLRDLIGGGRGIRTPKGPAPRWIPSPLPYQLRLALREQGLSHGPAVAARLARRAYVGRVRRTRPSMYGRSTDGIVTLPSVSWPFSSTAISARPTAKPEPLRVWQ